MFPRRARVVTADDSSLLVVQLCFGSFQRPLRLTISSLLTNVDLRAGSVRLKHEPLACRCLDLLRHVRSGSGVGPCLHPNDCREPEQKPLPPFHLGRFHRGASTVARLTVTPSIILLNAGDTSDLLHRGKARHQTASAAAWPRCSTLQLASATHAARVCVSAVALPASKGPMPSAGRA